MTGTHLPTRVICINNADHTANDSRAARGLSRLGATSRRAMLVVLLALACGEPTGPEKPIAGTVRLRSVFADGESAAALRLTVDSIHIVLTRAGSAAPIVDARSAFVDGAALGWVLELVNAREPIGARVELSGEGQLLYSATATLTAAIGPTGEAEARDVVVRYVGPPRAMAIAFSPDSATLTARGETREIGATALNSAGVPISGKAFTWTSSAPDVVSVDAGGRVTAVANGVAQITARVDRLDRIATVAVAIVAAPDRSTLDASPASQPADGSSAAKILVTLIDANDNPTGASSGTLSLSTTLGVLSAVVDQGDGTYTATLTSAIAGTATVRGQLGATQLVDSATIEFTRLPSVVTALEIAPTNTHFTSLGATRTLSAAARDQFGAVMPSVTFSWTSSAPAVSIDGATSLVTAVTNGDATITATAVGSRGVSASVVLSVAQVASTARSTITATATSLLADGTSAGTLRVALFDSLGNAFGASGGTVAIQSDRGTLSGVTDHADGTYSATITGTAPGLATISATIDGVALATQANVTFTRLPSVLTTIEVAPATATLNALGASHAYTAVARDQFGDAMPSVVLTWATNQPAVATINENSGVATAVSEGSVTFTVTAAGAPGVVGTATLTVHVIADPSRATLSATPNALIANGTSAATITIRLFDPRGNALVASRGVVALHATVGTLTPVTDNNDGTYSAALTSGEAGTSILSGTLAGVALGDSSAVEFTPIPLVVTTIDVASASGSLTSLGATHGFTAIVRDQFGAVMPGAVITWTSSAATVATIDVNTGVATAAANGSTTIVASAGDLSDTTTLTVAQAASAAQTNLRATPTAVIADGSPITVRVTLRDSRGNLLTASGGTVALQASLGTLTTVSDNSDGTYTATLSSAVAGTSVVSGTIAGAAIADTANAVFDPIILLATSVEVSSPTVALDALGATSIHTALVRDQFGAIMPGAGVTWKSSDPAVATIDAGAGIATAVSNGVTTVSASVTSAPGVSSSVTLTVAQLASDARSTLTAGADSIIADGTTSSALTVTVRDRLGKQLTAGGRTVAFETNVGDLSTVTDRGDGTYTATLTSTVVGRATVGALLDGAPMGAPTSIEITRVPPVVASIIVSPTTASLGALRATHTFTATAYEADGQTIPNATFTWQTDAASVATVGSSGVATAVGNGIATITATASNGVTASATITVQQRAATLQLQVSCTRGAPECVRDAFGETLSLNAVVRDSLDHLIASAVAQFTSSDTLIATVDAAGVVKALGNGSATITAEIGGVTAQYTVTVLQRVTQIHTTPPELWLSGVGASGNITATPRDRNGNAVADAEVTWSAADTTVALIEVTGPRTVHVTALKLGETRVFLQSAGITAKVIVKIR